MKIRMNLAVIISLSIMFLCSVNLTAQFGGGSGTESEPWEIETAEHLNNIRNYLGVEHSNKHFLQTANIDLGVLPWNEGDGWEPIGADNNLEFRGNYNGDGYVIDGLFINRPGSDYQGLFSKTTSASISDLGLTNVDITAGSNVGALAAFNYMLQISNCYSSGSINAASLTGGLVGQIFNSDEITNCHSTVNVSVSGNISGGLIGGGCNVQITESYSTGNVNGNDHTGGLAGIISAGIISNCHSTGNINGSGSFVGGLVGYMTMLSEVSYCYSIGNVNGSEIAGGLIGGGDNMTISNSYSEGNVNGTYLTGGFIGAIHSFTMSNCYSRGNVHGNNYAGGFTGRIIEGSVTNSYSTGFVLGFHNVGGFAGYTENIQDTHNYWNVETSQQSISAIGEGRTTAEMTYPYNLNTYIEWDFTGTWIADEDHEFNDGYPYLSGIDHVSADDDMLIPVSMISVSNYPNPFNPETTISFTLLDAGRVKIEIYNIKGQKIKTLINEYRSAGEHQVNWNGQDERGNSLPSGIYLYRLETGNQALTRKMMLLK